MRNGDEIKDIVAQLQRLQIQETELLQRLELLSAADSNASASPITTREFVIGDLVQILNPGRLQAKRGTVIKIGVGTNRITVQAKNGSKSVRAPYNLNLIHIN
jgi:hypothetical protein